MRQHENGRLLQQFHFHYFYFLYDLWFDVCCCLNELAHHDSGSYWRLMNSVYNLKQSSILNQERKCIIYCVILAGYNDAIYIDTKLIRQDQITYMKCQQAWMQKRMVVIQLLLPLVVQSNMTGMTEPR